MKKGRSCRTCESFAEHEMCFCLGFTVLTVTSHVLGLVSWCCVTAFQMAFGFFITIFWKSGKAQRKFGTLLFLNFLKIKFSFNNCLFCTGKVLLPCSSVISQFTNQEWGVIFVTVNYRYDMSSLNAWFLAHSETKLPVTSMLLHCN